MKTLSDAIQQGEGVAGAIMSMSGLDQSSLTNSKDGIEALIKAFVKKYSKE